MRRQWCKWCQWDALCFPTIMVRLRPPTTAIATSFSSLAANEWPGISNAHRIIVRVNCQD